MKEMKKDMLTCPVVPLEEHSVRRVGCTQPYPYSLGREAVPE